MADLTVKQGDTAVVFTDSLTIDGVASDLTGATVLFLLKKDNTEFSVSATIVNAALGQVSYGPGVLPLVSGRWKQEWEVTYASGNVLTFPSAGYNYLTIQKDLN